MSTLAMEQKKGLATSEPASVEAEVLDLELNTGPRERGPAGAPHLPRRRSQSTLEPELASRTSMPCAIREMSVEDCSRQRFIVWAAVKRNKSVRMAPSDRLCCPLLRCRERFEDHESMLQHLVKCQHLSTGEYVCYECMKVERFDDKKCRCCLAHPTKRRRIINIAKNFFSNIGHRSRRDEPRNVDPSDLAMPPPYESLQINAQPHAEQPEHPHIEINGREILELDSGPVLLAQLDSINYEPQTASSPEPSSMPRPTSNTTFTSTTTFAPREGLSDRERDFPMSSLSQSRTSTGSGRPSLALDTTHVDHYRNVPRTKYLSPSTSLRSTRSSQGISPITPWSSSSGSTGNWTVASSIETALTSPGSPSSPTGYLPAPQVEHAFVNPKDTENCFDRPDDYTFDALPELPGDNPCITQTIPRGVPDPLFSFDPKDNYSWLSSVDTTLSLGTSVNVVFTDSNSNLEAAQPDAPPSSSSTRTLIESAWGVLQEHVSSSQMKVALIPNNPLARRLQDETAVTLFRKGLSTLRYMLEGHDPQDPLDYLCFVHTIYAFSLVIHEEDMMTRCNRLFKQALAYRGFLNPSYFEIYSQVVSTIWQSMSDGQSQEQTKTPLNRSSSLKGKEPEYRMDAAAALGADPLIVVGQNFLDDIENAVISSVERGSVENLTSTLWSTHMTEPRPDTPQTEAFAITANYILQVLSQNFHDSDRLSSNLRVISQRVRNNAITTVRRLELEVLQAGKNSIDSTDLFDEYIPQVRGLCDPVYSQPGFTPRIQYHQLGLSLIESCVHSFGSEPHQRSDGTAMTVASGAMAGNVPDPLDEFLESLSETFQDSNEIDQDLFVDMSGPHQTITTGSAATVDTDPTINPSELHGSSSSRVITMGGTSVVTYQSRSAPPPNSSYPTPSVLPSSTSLPHTHPGATPPSQGESLATATSSSAGGTPMPIGPASAPAAVPSSSSTVAASSDVAASGPSASSSSSTSASTSKVEANDCCEICGYRPKGDPQWFKGSMAKHKKLQHSAGPPVIYKCPFPGCTSAYKNRPDNLRQHQLEKGHFVGDGGEGGEASGRRPSKKRKKGESSSG